MTESGRPTPVEPEARCCLDCIDDVGDKCEHPGCLCHASRRLAVEPEARQCPDCSEPIDSVAHWHEDKAAARRLAVEPDGLPLDVRQKARAALSLARSMILAGEPMSQQASAVFEETFAMLANTPSEAQQG